MAKKKQNKTYEYDLYMEDGSKIIFTNPIDAPSKIVEEITSCDWYIVNPDYNTTINCNKIIKIEVKENKEREIIA